MKKKVLALVLMMAMVCSLVACGNKNTSSNNNTNTPSNDQEQDNNTPDDNQTPDDANTPDDNSGEEEGDNNQASTPTVGGQIIIGSTTEADGDSYPCWTTNAADGAVYELTMGYSTVVLNQDGQYLVDPTVVTDQTVTENADGSKTVTYKLQENLKWSNGDPITAKDYVFYILFTSCPELLELGATSNIQGYRLAGFGDFNTGASKVFSGVRLLGDYEFAVTIDASNLPYYYEEALSSFQPYYMKGWVPEDVDILDDGEGCYFNDAFTVEHVKSQVDQYRLNPTAFSGPYLIENYNKTDASYTLKINPEFNGNFEGQKPYIETVIYRKVVSETMMDELATGGVDLLNGLSEGAEINKGLDMVEAGGFEYEDYPRCGYGQLIFICDRGPTQFVEVRHAIAYLLDRNEFCRTFTEGYGALVYSEYGLAQWMVEEAEEEIGALNMYNKSLDSAIKELEAGGWVLDKDGNDYTSGIRYKKLDDGTLMPLIIEWCSSEKNPVSDLLATMLVNGEDTAAAGMQINQSTVTFPELLSNYYQQKENNYNMYNMGQAFSTEYNPETSFETNGSSNFNRLNDPELTELAATMAKVPSGDDEAFLEKWIAYQQRWNELLPNLPLYSNVYHDFYNAKLKGYEGIKDRIWGLTSQIIYCWVEE